MTLYIGVDFHPHQQTVAWCDTQTGETDTCTLQHNFLEVFKFYQSFSPSIVGIEASSRAVWFEQFCRMATQEKFGLTFQPSLEMSENIIL